MSMQSNEASPNLPNGKTKIRSAGLEDQPSPKDFLGFTPYVNALYSFLQNDLTKPPFTLSIEGDWGAGKSSFMMQLQTKLIADKAIVINFNAWRHDKMESMWASFALTFIQQLERNVYWYLRPILNLIILLKRFDWRKGWYDLSLKAVFLVLYIIVAYAFIQRGGIEIAIQFLFANKEGKVEGLDLVKLMNSLGFAGLAVGGVFFLRKFADIFGNPLTIDLYKYISKPDYEGYTSFIEAFHVDFDRAVKVLAFNKKKIYVFIDDLDRAEIPKAAELMQGLNMMISNSPKIIFIIGMDREKVAAGVAAKYENMLKYVVGSAQDIPKAIAFGSAFLQKFIQLSFRIPVPSPMNVRKFINAINNSNEPPSNSEIPQDQIHLIMLEDGEDALSFKRTVELVAPAFDYNPRLLKQFVNGFRLKCHIAYNTGLFLDSDAAPMTIPQVGKFVAMIMIWPEIIDELIVNPDFIKEILTDPSPGETYSSKSDVWRTRMEGFVSFLNIYPNYRENEPYIAVEDFNMVHVNYKRLIDTSPAIVISPNDKIAENATKGTSESGDFRSEVISGSYNPYSGGTSLNTETKYREP